MSERDDASDSDAPEEFTSEQGQQQDVEIRKVERENKSRKSSLHVQTVVSGGGMKTSTELLWNVLWLIVLFLLGIAVKNLIL